MGGAMRQNAPVIGMLGMEDYLEEPYCPGTELFAYQRDWVNDDSRWKFGLMSRQVGKDFSCAFEGIRHCSQAEFKRDKTDWLIAAPSERQSLESLQKWRDWAGVFELALEDYEEKRPGGGESVLTSATIRFRHGSRVIAVPGKPETVRGYSANMVLTEFAFFEDTEATWRAIVPTITSPLRGGEKKVRLITTPNGIGNKAHDLWVKNYVGEKLKVESGKRKGGGHPPPPKAMAGREDNLETSAFYLQPSDLSPVWSCHFVDIYMAVRGGLGIDVAKLRAGLDDPDGWAQEFECRFSDTQAVLLPYDLMAGCESSEATAVVAPVFWKGRHSFPLVLGIDFGRHRDLSVAWSLSQLGETLQTVEVLELDRMSTPAQVDMLRPRIQQARRVCLDYTGAGIGLGDYLVKEFGEWNEGQHKFGKIELCAFSNAFKVEVFSKLRMAFERRGVRVPVNRAIREDLHSVNRVTSSNGQVSYRAAHTPDGHADRCTALALAVRAGSDVPAQVAIQRVPMRTGMGDMGMGRVDGKVWM